MILKKLIVNGLLIEEEKSASESKLED